VADEANNVLDLEQIVIVGITAQDHSAAEAGLAAAKYRQGLRAALGELKRLQVKDVAGAQPRLDVQLLNCVQHARLRASRQILDNAMFDVQHERDASLTNEVLRHTCNRLVNNDHVRLPAFDARHCIFQELLRGGQGTNKDRAGQSLRQTVRGGRTKRGGWQ